MNRTQRPWLVPAAITVAVLLVIARWFLRRSTQENPTPIGFVLVSVLVTLALAGVLVWGIAKRRRSLHRRVRAARPQHRLASGWSDASLGTELERIGVTERFRPQGGVPVVLAWSTDGLELWRAGRLVLTVGWVEVVRVSVGDGVAAALPRPAVVVELAAGARVVVVPARTESGGVLPATSAQTAALVTELSSYVRTRVQ